MSEEGLDVVDACYSTTYNPMPDDDDDDDDDISIP